MKKIDDFCSGIFMLLVSLVELTGVHLILDRTNWKVGDKNINILTLGLLHNDCFIPLCWQQMSKRGNSNFSERENLMNRFIGLWQKAGKSIANMVLVADREFIGPDWYNYLSDKKLSFVFRLKENMCFDLVKGKKRKQLKSYRGMIEKNGIHSIRVMVKGIERTIVMTKNLKQDKKEPYIYFISDKENAQEVLKDYIKRWKIECCFRHLKSNGFNVEVMNLKDDGKIQLMIGIVIIAYTLAIKEGLIEHFKHPIPFKKYKNGKMYLSVSLFRLGIEIIDRLVLTLKSVLNFIVEQLANPYPKSRIDKQLNFIKIKNVQ